MARSESSRESLLIKIETRDPAQPTLESADQMERRDRSYRQKKPESRYRRRERSQEQNNERPPKRSRSVSPLKRSGPLPDQSELFGKAQTTPARQEYFRKAPLSQSSAEIELERKWLNNEDAFMLKQMKNGSVIRIKDNRAKPIDWLVICLKLLEPNALSDTEFIDSLLGVENRSEADNPYDNESNNNISSANNLDIPEPSTVIDHLDEIQLDELLSNVKEFQRLDNEKLNHKFWESVDILCKERSLKLRQQIESRDNRVVGIVSSDIDSILSGKSYTDLVVFEEKVNQILSSDDKSVDRDFWLQLAKRLKTDKSKAQLLTIYHKVVEVRIALLEKVQKIESMRSSTNNSSISEFQTNLEIQRQHLIEAKRNPIKYSTLLETPSTSSTLKKPKSDSHSIHPRPLDDSDFDSAKPNEDLFNEEVESNNNDPNLIKPRYYNRVIMGYDWNRYNKAHYTAENPPPKAVQGYKFNIFYPKIESSATPTYKIIPDNTVSSDPNSSAGSNDTVILVFKAPAPYKDLAFRIVNQPWDRSSHRNAQYKSQFEDGVLQVHFRFKKSYYRK